MGFFSNFQIDGWIRYAWEGAFSTKSGWCGVELRIGDNWASGSRRWNWGSLDEVVLLLTGSSGSVFVAWYKLLSFPGQSQMLSSSRGQLNDGCNALRLKGVLRNV